jgi:shikimate dehydrogenase
MPHKEAVMALVDDPGGVRTGIGAMNTLVRGADGALFGTNTDAAGFFAPIADRDWSGSHVGIVGAGGAARAVLFALAQVGVGSVTLYCRNQLKGTGLLAGFGLKGRVLPMDASLGAADLLVNASPLGMKGEGAYVPDLAVLPPDAVVYDIVYVPLETPLLAAARARGLDVVDGLEMLVGQAAVAFELFFGQPPSDDDAQLRALLTA